MEKNNLECDCFTPFKRRSRPRPTADEIAFSNEQHVFTSQSKQYRKDYADKYPLLKFSAAHPIKRLLKASKKAGFVTLSARGSNPAITFHEGRFLFASSVLGYVQIHRLYWANTTVSVSFEFPCNSVEKLIGKMLYFGIISTFTAKEIIKHL